ncbi:hypothetical protein [Murinocardiopsis flavida]|uniref:hypothetical protein n=1 Tax=Murinocardiopsis flavida TaxID=645275 RepID=UPI001FE7A587|nr:hypothetical protein [Murinocardiopsis flavida]
MAAGALLLALALSADEAAWAAEDPATGTEELVAVVNRIRTVIVSLAAALATLLLTIGGLRWLLAGGDPGEIDKARRALMGAAIGYGIAILATVLMTILDYIVGGQ